MLVIRDLSRRYGSLLALDDVSLQAHPGQIVGLLGANGAGKSTLLRTAAGLQPPDAGEVLIGDVSLWDEPVVAKRGLGYAPEEPSFYEDLSADEYLAFTASVRQMDPTPARARSRDLAGSLGLIDRLDEPVRRFSYGMRKKLSFIAAVLHGPAVLLCDEALEGFDAAAALVAKQELRTLAKNGCAILFSSHVTESIERLCDRVIVLHRGRIARELDRETWGGVPQDISPLERVFLEIVGGAASKEAQ
jgi:ABC-2 type transport system ATP-binding protein